MRHHGHHADTTSANRGYLRAIRAGRLAMKTNDFAQDGTIRNVFNLVRFPLALPSFQRLTVVEAPPDTTRAVLASGIPSKNIQYRGTSGGRSGPLSTQERAPQGRGMRFSQRPHGHQMGFGELDQLIAECDADPVYRKRFERGLSATVKKYRDPKGSYTQQLLARLGRPELDRCACGKATQQAVNTGRHMCWRDEL